tara:strand:- start:26 stop:361 length:336 start_codon:yes stop_codon:yes gene_type:complete
MNIIDTEDMIKGLPDAALQKEAQNPSGQAPQFLVVSEIKRRKDMRERYAQNQQSQGTERSASGYECSSTSTANGIYGSASRAVYASYGWSNAYTTASPSDGYVQWWRCAYG